MWPKRDTNPPTQITEIGNFSFASNDITELIFHDNVTKIGRHAFSENYALESINFSDSIISIGDLAFALCPNLKNISLPENLEHLGSGAFNGCSGVENDSVLLPYGAKSIGSGVFAGMPPLKAVGLPDTLTSIDPKLFYNGDEKSIPAKFVYCTLYNDSYVRSILGDEDGFCYLPYYWPVSYNGSPEKLLPPDLPIISDPTNPDDEWFLEGWYTDQAMTNRWDFENDAVTRDTMLYANWQNRFITRHITFTTNSENTLPAQIINSGLSLSEPQITKKGHTFLGWYADSEFQTPYDFSSPVRSDLHLYAKWKINDYTATFDSAGGPAAPSQTLPYGSLLTPPQDMKRLGYTFEGWYADGSAAPWDFAAAPLQQDITLRAKWNYQPNRVILDAAATAFAGRSTTLGVYFTPERDALGFELTLRYDTALFAYQKTEPKAFRYFHVTEQGEDPQHPGFRLLTVTGQYNDSGAATGGDTVNPFDLIFDVLSSAVSGSSEFSVLPDSSYYITGDGDTLPMEQAENLTVTLSPVYAESIKIEGSGAIGWQPQRYTVIIVPEDATNKEVIWTVDDTSVATVDSSGLLSPRRNGTVLLTAATADGSGVSASLFVTITGEPAKIDLLTTHTGRWSQAFSPYIYEYTIQLPLSVQNISLTAFFSGGTLNLAEGGMLFNGVTKTVPVPFDSQTVQLTRTNVDGYSDMVYTLHFIKTPDSLSIKQESLNLTVGDQAMLQVSSLQKLFWTSSNEKVAAVQPDGTVTALGEGIAVITVQNEDGERVSCNVNVESKPSVYTISNLIINGSEISADILKNQDRKVKDYIFVSLYDQKGRLTGSSCTQLYFQAGKTTQFADLLECGNASTVKIFIWEGLSSLRPLSNVATAAIPQNGELSFSLTARCLENRE